MLYWFYLFTILFLSIFAIYIGIPAVVKIWMRPRFLAKIRKSNCVCITFDDGPDPRSTPQILQILRAHEAQATFFVLGKNAEVYPDLIRNILRDGHEIGEHSFTHTFAWLCDPLRSFMDVFHANRQLHKLRPPARLFRPPYGKLNLVTLAYTILFRREITWWDVDPRDYAATSAQEITQTAIAQIKPGSVLLLHDGRRPNTSAPELTIQALEEILAFCNSRNFKLATISKALANSIQSPAIQHPSEA